MQSNAARVEGSISFQPIKRESLPLEGSEAHGAVVNDCEHIRTLYFAVTDVRLKFAQERKLSKVSVIGQSRFCNNRRPRKDRREASIFGRQTVTMKYTFLYSVCTEPRREDKVPPSGGVGIPRIGAKI